MFTKVYRYHISPDKIEAFKALQRKAHAIYEKNVNYEISFYRQHEDDNLWLEIHTYMSEDDYKRALDLDHIYPEKSKLFDEFKRLQPDDAAEIIEETYDKVSVV